MVGLPSLHAAAAILVAIATFWMFARGRMRLELVCLLLIAVLALGFYFFPYHDEASGGGEYTGMEIAFGGFGHEALIAICCLMILGRGLVVTGALEPAARLLARLWRYSKPLGLLCALMIGAMMSMFVNDTPVLVLMIPVLLNVATRAGTAASKTLMPVNCAILIGGMATTIGTSTNLLVVSIAEDLGLPRFGVFAFTDIALTAGLIALPYLWLVMPRLLPEHSTATSESTREFDATLHVNENSSIVGVTASELTKKIGHGLKVVGVLRRGLPVTILNPNFALQPGDMIQVEGAIAQLREAGQDLKASLIHPDVLAVIKAEETKPDDDEIMAELVIGSDSALIGQSIKSAQVADRYSVAVIGVHRPNRLYFNEGPLSMDERLEIGDVLLVRGASEKLRLLQIGEGAMVLEGAAEMPRTAMAGVAVLIVATVVALAATHILPIAISSLAGAIAMIATGCVRFDRLGRALSGEVIVLVAASIALGRALLETGAAEWLGSAFAFGLQSFPPAVVLAAMMAFATLLTNFSSNTAAAAVGAPIAVSLAQQLNVPAEPMVLAVLFGCNLCYATPVAYQTNILIMSAGGYAFKDYVRAGLPLVILMIVSLSVLLVMKYGL